MLLYRGQELCGWDETVYPFNIYLYPFFMAARGSTVETTDTGGLSQTQ